MPVPLRFSSPAAILSARQHFRAIASHCENHDGNYITLVNIAATSINMQCISR